MKLFKKAGALILCAALTFAQSKVAPKQRTNACAAIFLLNRLLIHLHPFIKILTSLPLPPASSLYRATFKSLPTSSKSVGTVNE